MTDLVALAAAESGRLGVGIDGGSWFGQGGGVGDRRRVFVPQALGSDEFLRVTWHEGRRVVVFSHWDGDHCVAATPVRTDQLGELAELTVAALADSLSDRTWPAPDPALRVPNDLAPVDELSA